MSAASTSPKSKVDETLRDIGVQTVIKVYPFILPPSTGRASVTSDKKFCTVLSLETSTESSKFYNLLQYTPYHDIEENNLRVLNLPRKTKLQWVTNKFSEETLKAVSLADDDGIGQVCDDLLLRLRTGKKTQWTEAGTQTDLAPIAPKCGMLCG
ncbi:uncharacterized protein LOC126748504 isoform X2 [Anthonomus grandis grandis]|uniref:uncharacterized protein LOC126748504 isoform X2 n=1 Tax=Anthonomus grandis grandis TaxID=2921223 RepID=UPI002166B59E|nr:uncharacterized protein LOC126748504 isoform X2 [Anthonomus grandis grandis]